MARVRSETQHLALSSEEINTADMGCITLINYITRIHFGFGAVIRLTEEIANLNFSRPLLVTDRGLMETRIPNLILGMIPNAVIFFDTPQNPTEQSTRLASEAYAKSACDGIVALGGGSPIDLAKAAALLVTHQGPLSSYALANGGLDRIRPDIPSIIAIPTTAGTGSEVARATVIVTDGGAKLPIGSPYLIPKAAICDPDLTLDLPAKLTAATGFDALAHCVETFCSPKINPPAAAIALDGIRRVVRFLERAVKEGDDREARWHMLMAALQGGLTFQKGLGAVHALAHPLGELGVHHGTVNAILLPHVLRFNRSHITSKLNVLAIELGISAQCEVASFFSDLAQRCGLPTTLREIGIRPDVLSSVPEKAEKDSCNSTNPAPLTASSYEKILRSAL
jgi:alcohol dehydrogenase class IV